MLLPKIETVGLHLGLNVPPNKQLGLKQSDVRQTVSLPSKIETLFGSAKAWSLGDFLGWLGLGIEMFKTRLVNR